MEIILHLEYKLALFKSILTIYTIQKYAVMHKTIKNIIIKVFSKIHVNFIMHTDIQSCNVDFALDVKMFCYTPTKEQSMKVRLRFHHVS